MNRLTVALMRAAMRVLPTPTAPADVAVEDSTASGQRPVRVRVYRPRGAAAPRPALLWIHGGGFLLGAPEQDEHACLELVQTLGLVVASVDYRLAPENPFPAPLEDCAAAWHWLRASAPTLGVDTGRLALGGASAGGGLAAALAQYLRDRGEPQPCFQLLVYPMLDDRTAARPDDGRRYRVWTQRANVVGWRSYLGQAPGEASVPAHAVPARHQQLAGLPPAWIGVGDADLFEPEDRAYAERLRAAGVPCELHVVPGAFHGFDAIASAAPVSVNFRRVYAEALRQAVAPQSIP